MIAISKNQATDCKIARKTNCHGRSSKKLSKKSAMQMVLHGSSSGNKSVKYILNLNIAILRVLKKKQEKQHDELTVL